MVTRNVINSKEKREARKEDDQCNIKMRNTKVILSKRIPIEWC